MVWHGNPRYTQTIGSRTVSEARPGEKLETYLKAKRIGTVAQVIEDLSSKCEVLSWNPSTGQKKEKIRSLKYFGLSETMKSF
jgi:hypothetical protein